MLCYKSLSKLHAFKFSVLLIVLFMSLSQVQAQTSTSFSDDGGDVRVCGVIHDPRVDKIMQSAAKAKRVPGYYRPETPHDVIFKSDYTYVFRLAVCISKESFYSTDFNGDRQAVYQFWDDLEAFLDEVYGRDCGIQFDFVRDDRLIVSETSIPLKESTKLINSLIGSENYDLGILIKPDLTRLKGEGVLGGVYSQYTKGEAWSVTAPKTIAHELGHVLGANHTHERDDAKIGEQGQGFSIMSYGSPRTFFSMYTIQEIRSTLSRLGHYTDASRQTYVKGMADTDNAPYVVPLEGEKPVLDRNALRDEYVVTKGTRYQFYIPVRNTDSRQFEYNAHQFDITLWGSETNLIQRLYHPSERNVVMFGPRYVKPVYYTSEATPAFLKYSDEYNTGLYTYCLSAFNHGYHDATTVKLRIVEGKPFKMTSVTLDDDLFFRVTPGKSRIRLTWNPCSELYGDDSKVRILLSTDFGKTFEYVLADEVPNSGSWSGVMPYVKIGNVYNENIDAEVRGGVLKVEVVGQAAYALSTEVPYICQGREVIYIGGFITKNDNLVTFAPQPEIYKEVDSEDEIGNMPELKASAGGTTVTADASTEWTGHTLYRRWTARVGGKQSVYTQVIKIKQPIGADAVVRKKAERLAALANELYRNIGKMGYPKADIKQSQQLKARYETVYTEDGKPQANLDAAAVDAMEQVLIDIGTIDDDKVVMPTVGKTYKIASYHEKYGTERYFYLKQPESADTDPLMARNAPEEGAEWKTGWVDGLYRFTAGGMALHLSQTARDLKGMRLTRGYTWGSFCFMSGDKTRIAQVNEYGNLISFNYGDDMSSYKANRSDMIISTDFRLVEVPAAFDVFYRCAGPNARPMAYLPATGGTAEPFGAIPGQPMDKVADGLYKITVPQGYGHDTIVFTESDGRSTTAQLYGCTATYNANGRRVLLVNMEAGKPTSIYNDMALIIPDGLTACTIETERGEGNVCSLQPTKLNNVIPAHTPVLLYATTTRQFALSEADADLPRIESDGMFGALPAISAEILNADYLYFPLKTAVSTGDSQTLSFPIISDNSEIPAHTAYVRLYKYDNNQHVKEVVLDVSALGNIANGISSVSTSQKNTDYVYDLQGRRVASSANFNSLPHGIYIVNGRKVVK
ncbi:MAG: reprolysin-like metallopeptidase [Prevotella sp.]|jgi:hypothetical protein